MASPYPENPHDYSQLLSKAYEEGPGAEPGAGTAATGLLVPDGMLDETGALAAWAYQALGAQLPPLVIILQQGPDEATSTRSWELPVGTLRADHEFIIALTKKGNTRLDEESITAATALQAQLPFIYSANPVARVVPLTVRERAEELALDIKETLIEQGKQAIIIAASSMTRHGPRHQHVQFTLDPPAQVEALDARLIASMESAEHFRELCAKEFATLSGVAAITTLLRSLPPSKPKLLAYEQRGEKSITAYAVVLFEDSRGVTNI